MKRKEESPAETNRFSNTAVGCIEEDEPLFFINELPDIAVGVGLKDGEVVFVGVNVFLFSDLIGGV